MRKKNRSNIITLPEKDRLNAFINLVNDCNLSKEYEDRCDDELEDTLAEVKEIFNLY